MIGKRVLELKETSLNFSPTLPLAPCDHSHISTTDDVGFINSSLQTVTFSQPNEELEGLFRKRHAEIMSQDPELAQMYLLLEQSSIENLIDLATLKIVPIPPTVENLIDPTKFAESARETPNPDDL